MKTLAKEVMQKIEALQQIDDDGIFTTRELQKALDCGKERALRILRHMIDSGHAESAGRCKRNSIDGRVASVPGYRLIK
jgi:hypothetical protein